MTEMLHGMNQWLLTLHRLMIDDAKCAPTISEREVLDLPISPHGQNDLRCIQLMQYICETNFPQIYL